MSVCGLSLDPSSLNPLLRALKLQASLTELRISGNRLHDALLPELVATAITMPRLRLLDVSACQITGEGLEKAVNALKGQSHPAFPVGRACFYMQRFSGCQRQKRIRNSEDKPYTTCVTVIEAASTFGVDSCQWDFLATQFGF